MKDPVGLSAARVAPRSVQRAADWVSDQARLQFITRNRRVGAMLALATVAVAIIAAHVSAWLVSPGVMILPILCGGLLLWPRALRVLGGIAAAGLGFAVVLHKG